MTELTIKTDNKWREFRYCSEVPPSVLANEFDYLDENETDGFFWYRNCWYHLSMFMRIVHDDAKQWDAYHSDSAFSGVMIKLSRDGEQFKVCTYMS